jgi:hypothetical protein
MVSSSHRQSYGSDRSDSPSGRSGSQNGTDVAVSSAATNFDSPPPNVTNGAVVHRRSTPAEPKVPALAELRADLRKLASGRFDVQPTFNDKVIYVFHCAGFTG